MNLAEFRSTFQALTYGKRLPTALYLFRPTNGVERHRLGEAQPEGSARGAQQQDVPEELFKLVRRAQVAAQPDANWNRAERDSLHEVQPAGRCRKALATS